MKKTFLGAALLLLAACNDGGGVMREIQRAEQQQAQASTVTAQSSEEFLEQVAAQPGVERRPSGLLLEVRQRGSDQTLPRPTAAANVLVHYEGRLADGSVFDSSFARNEPAEFPLGAVVQGFSEAIQQMRPGDEVIATFPMELGYGPNGRPPVIPPAAALQFRIVLLAFQEPGGAPVQAPQ
ncbi:MAG: FKBP-type peptidyl-prolyl cis-trans isomerase [Hyphomonadaceae bacterium]